VAQAWVWQAPSGPSDVGFWRLGPPQPGTRAAFSSRLGGVSGGPFATLNLGGAVGDDPAAVACNRQRFAAAVGFRPEAVARLRQVHGADVVAVDRPGDAGSGDALCTDVPGVVLAVAVADCAAVYLVDLRRRAVALCHAGWRGTVADVAGRAVAELGRRYGSRPEDLWAAISPAIGPCCYEVGESVIGALRAAVPWAEAVLRPAPEAPAGSARARLDLWEANRLRLRDAGVPDAQVHVAGVCTACDAPRLFSHRRDRGRTGRMEAVLWLLP
jgi:YfiH family protein